MAAPVVMPDTVGMHDMRIVARTTTRDAIVVVILTFARCGSTVTKDRMRRGIVVWTTGIVLGESARCGIIVEMDRMRRGVAVWTTGIVLNGSARCGVTVEMDRMRRGIVVWTTGIVVTARNEGARCRTIVEVHRRRGGIVVCMTTASEDIVLNVGTRCGTGVGLARLNRHDIVW